MTSMKPPKAITGGATYGVSMTPSKAKAGNVYSSVALKRRKKREELAARGVISSANVNDLDPSEIALLRRKGALPSHDDMAVTVAKRRASARRAANTAGAYHGPVPQSGQLQSVAQKRKRRTPITGRRFG